MGSVASNRSLIRQIRRCSRIAFRLHYTLSIFRVLSLNTNPKQYLMKKRHLVFFSASLFVITLSCKNASVKIAEKIGSAASGMSRSDDELQFRNELIGIFNDVQSDVREWRNKYAEYIDLEKGPAENILKSNIQDYLWPFLDSDMGSLERKLKPIAEKAAGSKDELYQQAAVYTGSIQKLAETMHVTREYYRDGKYKEDKLAKAKELHPQVVTSFEAYFAAEKALETVLDKMEQEELTAMLEKSKGKNPVQYKALSLQRTAKEMLNAADFSTGVVDTAKLRAAALVFEADAKELQALLDKMPDDPAKSTHKINVESFLRQCGELLSATRKLNRELDAPHKDKYTRDQVRESFLNNYNSLTNYFGSMANLDF